MTKKLEQVLKKFLQDEPSARNRINKVRAIAYLLRKNHPAIKDIPKEVIINIIDETIALERYWRKVLLKCPELRGKDWADRHRYSQLKQMELGYESGYNENKKKLKTL